MAYVRLKEVDISASNGRQTEIAFVLRGLVIKPQNNGGEFAAFKMTDGEKSVDAKIFSIKYETRNKLAEGKVYGATVEVKPYKPKGSDVAINSCIITEIAELELNPLQFADWAPNMQESASFVSEQLASCDGTVYHSITKAILIAEWDKFSLWPAARGQHHTQLGGLLWHTASVLKSALSMAEVYKEIYGEQFINNDLLICGALLHDIMKTRELELDKTSGVVGYSDSAALTTHIMDTMCEVYRVASTLGIEQTEEVQLLIHMVASHHGKNEWGSPVTPSIPEAYILFKADELDAEMWKHNRKMADTEPGKYATEWVNGSYPVSRYREKQK